MKVLSIQVGKPKTVGIAGATAPMDREWTSGIFKETISGKVFVSSTGIDGDGQADLKVHGGVDKAINVYPADHFDYWRGHIGIDFPNGAFGENFTTIGGIEDDDCIGDIYVCGDVRLEVTQPREPCWKLARKWKLKDLSARVEKTGRTGWYFRVLQEGYLEAPFELVLSERPYPQWTLTKANEIMHHRKENWEAAASLSVCPALSAIWKEALARRSATQTVESNVPRLGGND